VIIFEAASPNRNWIADFTYVRTAEGRLSAHSTDNLNGHSLDRNDAAARLACHAATIEVI
jgi:hypothetical protein